MLLVINSFENIDVNSSYLFWVILGIVMNGRFICGRSNVFIITHIIIGSAIIVTIAKYINACDIFISFFFIKYINIIVIKIGRKKYVVLYEYADIPSIIADMYKL